MMMMMKFMNIILKRNNIIGGQNEEGRDLQINKYGPKWR